MTPAQMLVYLKALPGAEKRPFKFKSVKHAQLASALARSRS